MTFLGKLELHTQLRSSLEGWTLISSRSTSHNPFPPAEWCLLSYKLSSTSCNILLSWSNNSNKIQRFLLALILFPFSCAERRSHVIIAGSEGHYQETGRAEGKMFWQQTKSSAFQRPRRNAIKAWKKAEVGVVNYKRVKSNGRCTTSCQTGFWHLHFYLFFIGQIKACLLDKDCENTCIRILKRHLKPSIGIF